MNILMRRFFLSLAILIGLVGFGTLSANQTISLDNGVFDKPLRGGQPHFVRWECDAKIGTTLRMEFSHDGGKTWQVIEDNLRPDISRHAWKIPANVDSKTCLFRLTLIDTDRQQVAVAMTETPFVVDSTAPAVKILGPNQTNDRTVNLKYDVDDGHKGSGVSSIRLFYRKAGTRRWSMVDNDHDARSPYPVTFPGRGTYDLVLVAKDLSGNATPVPTSEMKAATTITINSGEPQVTFKPVRRRHVLAVGESIRLQWSVRDEDLGETPLSLYYRDANRRWHVVEENMPLSTEYIWNLPKRDFRVNRVRLVATDKTGKSSSAEIPITLLVDATPPTATLTGPDLFSEPDKALLLNHKVSDNGGSGLKSYTLYWRKQGNKEWLTEVPNVRSVYQKIPFDKGDGVFELILSGKDQVGNEEEVPTDSSKPELVLMVDRAAPRIVITDMIRTPEGLRVSWLVEDANLTSLPLTLDYPGGSKKGLPAMGHFVVPMTNQVTTADLKLTVIDLVGNESVIRETWKGKVADPIPVDPIPVDPIPVDPIPVDPIPVDPIPVDPVPVLTFTTKSQTIAPGQEIELAWTSENVKDLKATLLHNNEKTLEVRDAIPGINRLKFRVDGKHLDFYSWKFEGEGIEVQSPLFQLDVRGPEVQIEAPQSVLLENGRVSVKVHLNDNPAGIKEATLWVADNPEWKGMRSHSLDVIRMSQSVSLPFDKAGSLYITVSATDKVGNSLAQPGVGVRPLTIIKVIEPVALAEFSPLERKLFAGGSSLQLQWTSQHIKKALILERQEETGQWTSLAELPAEARTFRVVLPDEDRSRLQYRLSSGGKVLALLPASIQVDATAPKVTIDAPEKVTEGPFNVSIKVVDSGPAGYEKGSLYGRRRGDKEWKLLATFTKSMELTLNQKPGNWEFTSSLIDEFGRGMPVPAEGTVAQAHVAVVKKLIPHLALKVKGNTLVQGGGMVSLEIDAQNLGFVESYQIEDISGNIVAIREEPGVFRLQAPRMSLDPWTLTVRVGDRLSEPAYVHVDNDPPKATLKLKDKIVDDQNAIVIVESEDQGPGRVDKLEIYRSDDFGASWNPVEPVTTTMQFAFRENPVWLVVRARDGSGLWSRPTPAANSLPSLILDWVPEDFGFDTFTNGSIYRGGDQVQVRWHGIRQVAELQYLPGKGMAWIPLTKVRPGQRVWNWILPVQNTRDGLLRFTSEKGVELFRTPTSFAIDSTPARSRLNFVAADMVMDQVDYSRPRVGAQRRDVLALSSSHRAAEGDVIATRTVPGDPDPQTRQIKPYDFSTYLSSARDLMNNKQYGKAARHLESAHRLRDDVAESHHLLAVCYQKMHRENKMIVDQLHRAVELDPRLGKAWNHLGVLAKLREDRDLAKTYFLRAVDTGPLPESYLNLGILHHEGGQMTQAESHFKRVRELLRTSNRNPAYLEATWRLTMLYSYTSLKDINRARRFWAQVIDGFGRESWQGRRGIKWLREHDGPN